MPLKTDFSRAYDRFGYFKPLDGYDKDYGRLLEYSSGLQLRSVALSDIIFSDYCLRALTQRIDDLEQLMEPLQQQACSKEDLKTLQRYERLREKIKECIPEFEMEMFSAEVQLPERLLKRAYDKIRENPTWYLRPELIKDCIERGGCCGKSCRCCERRYRPENGRRGIGHCTVLCGCCGSHRESDSEKIGEAWDQMAALLHSKNPSYLLALAEGYFCMPGIFGLGRISLVRTIAWHWKNRGLWQWKRVSKWLK